MTCSLAYLVFWVEHKKTLILKNGSALLLHVSSFWRQRVLSDDLLKWELKFWSSKIIDELKALDTFGSYQRPVFSLDVSQLYQHMHKMLNLWKFWLNCSLEQVAREWWKKKHPRCTNLFAFRCPKKQKTLDVKWFLEWEITSFSKTMFIQRESFLSTALHCLLPSILYSNKDFEYLPIVSKAFIET